MRVFLLPLLISVALILSACSTPKPSPTAIPEVVIGSDNTSMDSGNMGMSGASGAATPTPGSMMPNNPEAAHMMEPIGGTNVQLATEPIGGQPLTYREEKGVKVFELTTKAVQWPILDGVTVTAYTYNGTVPGPMIRVTEGDQVRIIVKNELDDPTADRVQTLH